MVCIELWSYIISILRYKYRLHFHLLSVICKSYENDILPQDIILDVFGYFSLTTLLLGDKVLEGCACKQFKGLK